MAALVAGQLLARPAADIEEEGEVARAAAHDGGVAVELERVAARIGHHAPRQRDRAKALAGQGAPRLQGQSLLRVRRCRPEADRGNRVAARRHPVGEAPLRPGARLARWDVLRDASGRQVHDGDVRTARGRHGGSPAAEGNDEVARVREPQQHPVRVRVPQGRHLVAALHQHGLALRHYLEGFRLVWPIEGEPVPEVRMALGRRSTMGDSSLPCEHGRRTEDGNEVTPHGHRLQHDLGQNFGYAEGPCNDPAHSLAHARALAIAGYGGRRSPPRGAFHNAPRCGSPNTANGRPAAGRSEQPLSRRPARAMRRICQDEDAE
mmetsp:Transcript_39341/g.113874  ORF Transcript_39341/g.113874 Transcript_39341/m.113874 type:complete len:320 (+) Transcript_39341:520-1479(+)